MKRLILLFVVMVATISFASGQAIISNINIVPGNPSPNDTIYIIYDISYQGNCQFGLVDTYISETDSSIYVMPLYCGYWDSTWCNRIDTIKLGLFPEGNHAIHVEYHQGSVCPISNFDATIAGFDTVLVVGTNTSSISDQPTSDLAIIYPNPAHGSIMVDLTGLSTINKYRLKIVDVTGRIIYQDYIIQKQFSINCSTWASGTYFLSLSDDVGKVIEIQNIIVN